VSRVARFDHEFVEFIPRELAVGVIYVSIPYATAAHLCACGCGNRVTTPVTPRDWALTYDGESISLTPSIGNWSFPCQSHYWIKHSRVSWSRKWSRAEIDANRARDRRAKERSAGGEPRVGGDHVGRERETYKRRCHAAVRWWRRRIRR
jgi:hypothetical protein